MAGCKGSRNCTHEVLEIGRREGKVFVCGVEDNKFLDRDFY